jgi:hypothetical protein
MAATVWTPNFQVSLEKVQKKANNAFFEEIPEET